MPDESSNRLALLRAIDIAKISLSQQEQDTLVKEIDEVLKVFSKIDDFKLHVDELRLPQQRKLRKDKAEKSDINPFSNSKLVRDWKFIGPKLVD